METKMVSGSNTQMGVIAALTTRLSSDEQTTLSSVWLAKLLALVLVRFRGQPPNTLSTETALAYLGSGLFVEAPLNILWNRVVLSRIYRTISKFEITSKLGAFWTKIILKMVVYDPILITLHFSFLRYMLQTGRSQSSSSIPKDDRFPSLENVLPTAWKLNPIRAIFQIPYLPRLSLIPTELMWNVFLCSKSIVPIKSVQFAPTPPETKVDKTTRQATESGGDLVQRKKSKRRNLKKVIHKLFEEDLQKKQ